MSIFNLIVDLIQIGLLIYLIRPDLYKKTVKEVKVAVDKIISKDPITDLCHFCGARDAAKTLDGYFACPKCRITKLHHV